MVRAIFISCLIAMFPLAQTSTFISDGETVGVGAYIVLLLMVIGGYLVVSFSVWLTFGILIHWVTVNFFGGKVYSYYLLSFCLLLILYLISSLEFTTKYGLIFLFQITLFIYWLKWRKT